MNVVQVAVAEGLSVDAATRRRCGRFLRGVLRLRGLQGWELSLLLCDDATIRRLNRKYRGVDAATDVLSFSQREQGPERAVGGPVRQAARGRVGQGGKGSAAPAGDVVVSLGTLRRNAARRRISASEELKRLLIHGILHLEGLDHHPERSGGREEPMIILQERLLQQVKRGTLL